jgi:hypothetical protein
VLYSQFLRLCKVTISDYYETLLVNGIGHKGHTHQRHERSVKAAVSGFSWCAFTCNFTHCEEHNGLARAQNLNLSPLTSETMWYQPILIEHLTVLLLLQQHAHFSSSRRVSMWTLVVENVVHADIYETRDCSKSSSEPFEKCILQIVREIRILVPKLFVSLVQKFGERGPKRKKRTLFVPFFERLRSHMGSRTGLEIDERVR